MYQAIPLQGVGPITFGMARHEVHAQLGRNPRSFQKAATSAQTVDAWHNNAFQVFYGPTGTVEYIELSRTNDFELSCCGVSVFDTPASSVIKHFIQYAATDVLDQEYGSSIVFPSLELSLWRPTTAPYFSTAGVGMRGYYSNAA